MQFEVIFEDRVHSIEFGNSFVEIDGLHYVLPKDVTNVRDAIELAFREIKYNPKHNQGAM
jgi:hypothetical protein